MKTDESRRLSELAERLDCITDEDFALLANVKLDTVRTWRHRGEGPAYYKAGNRALYSITAVHEWLGTRTQGAQAAVQGEAA